MVNHNHRSWMIAIPSHDRYEQIQKKTLKLLCTHGIQMNHVYVFVSPHSHTQYSTLIKNYGINLVKSKNSILKTRNHIIEYFPCGAKVIEMDDDVEDIQHLSPDDVNQNRSVQDLVDLFDECFHMLNGSGLWGFNANTNSHFTSGIDKYGLYSIINSCLGYYNDKRIRLTVPEKEDFERCIQFYELGLPICKRTGFGIKTRYWKNKGGIQSKYNFETRVNVQRKSADMIMSKYPGLCYRQYRKNGICDIRFKSPKPRRSV